MPGFISDTPLAHDLIRIGDQAIARQDNAALPRLLRGGLRLPRTRRRPRLRSAQRLLRLTTRRFQRPANRPRADHRRRQLPRRAHHVLRRLHRRVHPLPHRPRRAHRPTPQMGSDRHVQIPRQRAAGPGVGADRLPQLPDQLRRHHDGVRRAGEVVASTLHSPVAAQLGGPQLATGSGH